MITKMKKVIQLGLIILFSIATGLLTLTTIRRLTWDYNENGVHFDEESMTTYNEGAIISYGMLTLTFLILTIMLGRNAINDRKRKIPSDNTGPKIK